MHLLDILGCFHPPQTPLYHKWQVTFGDAAWGDATADHAISRYSVLASIPASTSASPSNLEPPPSCPLFWWMSYRIGHLVWHLPLLVPHGFMAHHRATGVDVSSPVYKLIIHWPHGSGYGFYYDYSTIKWIVIYDIIFCTLALSSYQFNHGDMTIFLIW